MEYYKIKANTINDLREAVGNNALEESFIVASEHGVTDIDFDKFVECYIDTELDKLDRILNSETTIVTGSGPVQGRFIGIVEYIIAGDPETGWETDYDMAFETNNNILRAWKCEEVWKLEEVSAVGGLVRLNEYPSNWSVEQHDLI